MPPVLIYNSTFREAGPTPRGLSRSQNTESAFRVLVSRCKTMGWMYLPAPHFLIIFDFFEISSRFYIEAVSFLLLCSVQDEDPTGRLEVGWTSGLCFELPRARDDSPLTTSNPAQNAGAAALGLVLVAVEDGQQALPNLAGLLAGVDGLPDARLLVVAHDRGSLLVVGGEALLEGFGIVVGPLDQGLARDVVGHGLLWRVEGQVVAPARGRVHQPARDARHQQGVVDLQLHSVLKLLVALPQHLIEALGLRHGTGEAVEDESGRGEGRVSNKRLALETGHSSLGGLMGPLPSLALLVVIQLSLDHADDDVVTDEATSVHDLLGLPTQRSLLGDLGP